MRPRVFRTWLAGALLLTKVFAGATERPSHSVPDQALAERLFSAVQAADTERATLALAMGVDVNTRRHGLTALHLATIQGDEAMVRLLVSKGAAPNLPMPAPEEVIDARLREAIAGDSAGVAVLTARDSKILFARGYGYASLEHRVPVCPATKFRIGSITKQFTAAAILRLQEQNRLKVTDTLAQFIPDYPHGQTVTLHHLLTHTSGIHDFANKPDFLPTITLPATPEDKIKSFKNDSFDFAPGDKWSYSNSGYFLLGHIVEIVTGRTYADFLRREFFEPLGMTNTGVHTSTAILRHEATGYSYRDGAWLKAINWDMSNDVGSGALYSTVEDLFRWNEAVFAGRVLNEATLKAAFTPVVTREDSAMSSPKESGYGYGWTIFHARGLRTIEHEGSLDGFQSTLRRFPDQRFTVVVLANANPAPSALNPANLAQEIAQLYLWREMLPRSMPKSLSTLSAETFDAYLGRYDLGWSILTMSREGKRFFAQIKGQNRLEVYPIATNRFAWKTFDADIQFVTKPGGEVTKGVFQHNGNWFHAPRMPDTAGLPTH
jgi:CubicO group peptidase (beta-lactamase class C family)